MLSVLAVALTGKSLCSLTTYTTLITYPDIPHSYSLFTVKERDLNWFSKLAIVFSILLVESVSGQTSFTDVTNQMGLGDYRCFAGDLHSPGGVFTDLDNDGYADLYLVSSDGASGYNRIYLNVPDGSGGRTFSLQSSPSGNALGAENETGTLANDPFNPALFGENRFRGVTGAIAGDYDNDGDVDLYVTNMGLANRLYQNQLIETGALSFIDVTSAAGGVTGINSLVRASNASAANNNSDDSLTAVWFDPDRDGDLDLYVGNHSDGSDPVPFMGSPDTFYINNGDGTFTDSTAAFNLGGHEDQNGNPGNYADTNIVVSSDINNDGWVDLIVTNKSGMGVNGTDNIDQIYINDGADANGNWLGYTTLTYSLVFADNLITRSAMGMDIADIDNDGDMDIFISDNPESGVSGVNGSSNLFVNQLVETGSLSFVHGLVDTGLSWGVQIQDFDNDGDMEVHTTNDANANGGYAALLEFVDLQNLVRPKTFGDASNPLFQGRFTNTIPVGDIIANVVDIAVSAGAGNLNRHDRGNIAADFNRDGLVDMFLVNVNSDFRFPQSNDTSVLLMNNTNSSNNFLNVKLIGSPDNLSDEGFATSRDAVGSRVIVSFDGTELSREVKGGHGNASSTSSYDQMFGVGQATEVEVSVIWADGRVTEMGSVATNQFLVIDQEEAINLPNEPGPEPGSNQIFLESFDGTGGSLTGTTEDLAGVTWSANGFATDNGVLNVGPANMEGSATLPITLVADTVYTIEMDVTSNAAEWIGLGFSENPSSAVANRPQDRFAQSGGRAWFLYRPGEVGANALDRQVEIFGGANTANPIPDLNTDFSGPTVERTLTVVLDTGSAGFTADFLIDGVSQSNGPQPLFDGGAPLTDLTLLDNVGFTWEGQSGGGVAGAITVSNFSVSDNTGTFLLGDVNRDEVVNFFDISPFIDLLSGSEFQLEADIDGNGEVDFFDISPFIEILSGG